MDFLILLAYVVITAIWVGVLIVLNHKAGDGFEWEGDDDGTTFLWILFYCCALAFCRARYLRNYGGSMASSEPWGGFR